MKHFAPLLKKINSKLDLPQPTKSKILLEIAADLDDLYQTYLKRGMNEEEAYLKAQEKFDVTDKTISDLIEIHDTPYRKWMSKIGDRKQSIWENNILFFAFVFIAVVTIRNISTTPFFQEASIFVYPLLFLFVAVLIQASVKLYQLYIKRDHRIKNLRKGLNTFLYLAAATIFFGVGGYFIELYWTSSETLLLGPFFVVCLTNTDQSLPLVVDWLSRNSSMLMGCILILMFTGLFWFILSNKISKIEQAEVNILLNE